MNADDKNLRFVPIEKAIIPPENLIEHLKDCFWCCHPEKGIMYWKQSPQCNMDEHIAIKIRDSLYPWAEIRFIPSVFRKINPHDYC